MDSSDNLNIDIDFALIVHCRSHSQSNNSDSPFAVPSNLLSAWADPFWTGGTCASTQTLTVGDGHSGHSTFFHVKWNMRPVEQSKLQAVINPITSENKKQKRGICNSIKIHFFNTFKRDNETVMDYLYATCFPLELLLRGDRGCFGAFSCTLNAYDMNPLLGVRIHVIPLFKHKMDPRFYILLSAAGTSTDHHDRMLTLTTWIKEAFDQLFPGQTFLLSNHRSIMRDRGSSWLFQDFVKLYQTNGTCIPPIVALYALCNALMVNAVEPAAFLQMLNMFKANYKAWQRAGQQHNSDPSSESQKLEYIIIHILRAVVACFSMCVHEGKYWLDKCGTMDVEDQPFPMTFMEPSDRVFPKDDCEGRAAQTQQMVELLRSLYKAKKKLGIQGLAGLIRSMPSIKCLRLSDASFTALLMGCCKLGKLLETGGLYVHTITGLADFNCLKEKQKQKYSHCRKVRNRLATGGHCFSIAISGTGKTQCVIESTGWERINFPGENQLMDSHANEVMENLEGILLSGIKRSQLERVESRFVTKQFIVDYELENELYKTIFLGNDCVFFTTRTGQQYPYHTSQINKDTNLPPIYGATLKDIRTYGLKKYPEQPQQLYGKMNNNSSRTPETFTITTRRFIEELCEQKPSKAARLWKPIKEAESMLKVYDKIQETLIECQRCLRPPPMEEQDMEKIITERWGTITEEDLKNAILNVYPLGNNHKENRDTIEFRRHNQFFFSIKDDPESVFTDEYVEEILKTRGQATHICKYPFMCSRMFCVTFSLPPLAAFQEPQ